MTISTDFKPMSFNLRLKLIRRSLTLETVSWRKRKFSLPAPDHIKRSTMIRHSIDGDWIETGTYLGQTSKFLAKKFKKSTVITIEPSKSLHLFSSKRLSKFNVVCLLGSSEEVLSKAIDQVGVSVNFWLDGHYSGDVTFKGVVISPVIEELQMIASHLPKLKDVCIFIDDVRLFKNGPENSYPDKVTVVQWCIENDFTWDIEFDIFILKRRRRHD